MVGGKRTGVRVAIVAAAAMVVAGACTSTPGPGPTTVTPGIVSFAASPTAGPTPLTTTFTWNVTGPASLTCSLDTDGDGTFEISVTQCTSAKARAVTFHGDGVRTARLRVSDGTTTVTSAPLTVTVGAAPADAFDITLRFDPSVTAAQRSVFESAAARWSEVVRTGLPDVAVDAAADFCGTGAPAYDGNVDDLLIDATVSPIDGSGGVLGQAGPCLVRGAGGLPVFGSMAFDSADVADMTADGSLHDVILHEMGHVLGIGTVWDGLVAEPGTDDPRFVGLTARGAWSATTGGPADGVPVEATGGVGTAGSHWRESTFTNELMTGWISAGANPLSEVTAGALADLGYGVDLDAADALPWAVLRAPASSADRLSEHLIRPSGTVGAAR